MAKSKSKNVKSNKKEIVKRNKKETVKRNVVDKKIDEMTSSTSNELLKLFRILFIVIVVLGAFYLLTVAIVGSDKEEEAETSIQYEEILAGSSFNMRDSEYVVVYYDFTDTELSDLATQIYSYSYTGEYRLYTVDMSNGFNKPYVTGEDSYKSPNSAEDLLIKGPTLIKFKEGKVEKYVEGLDEVLDYLGKDN